MATHWGVNFLKYESGGGEIFGPYYLLVSELFPLAGMSFSEPLPETPFLLPPLFVVFV